MQVYAYELTVGQKGTVTLTNLPFNVGEQLEVIVISRPNRQSKEKKYPFWGKPITYINPTEPVAEEDWEVLQ